jgi:hypothetical protein
MKRTINILLGLVLTISGFSQTNVKVRILPSKISTRTEMLIPVDKGIYLYEKYDYFKYVYWLIKQDTLIQTNDTILKGSEVIVNLQNNYFEKDKCDTLINEIRNSSLSFRTSSMLSDTAKKYIGYDNEKFRLTRNENSPTESVEREFCHNKFKQLNKKWFDFQLKSIENIKQEKQTRLEEIKKTERFSKEYVSIFLSDFNNCSIDKIAIIEIMTKSPNEFLIACKKLSDTDFYGIKLKLSDLPENIKTDMAIKSLNSSDIKTNRKRKLIHKLKKNEG